eukprot:scaffold16.g45.t1
MTGRRSRSPPRGLPLAHPWPAAPAGLAHALATRWCSAGWRGRLALAAGAAVIGCYFLSIVWEAPVAPLQLAGGTGGAAGPASEAAQFTLLVMTTAARLATLRMVLAHYARCCPSLAEVVLVWNGGPPPAPGRDLPPLCVPLRVRVEANNSLNNRFRPDPQLKTRAVLHMDDDILVRCSDVERGFRAWQARPDALVGYFPRLLLPGGSESSAAGGGGGDALANGAGATGGQPLQYLGEREVFARGAYNAILTGAAFLDAPLAAELYWGEGNAEGRAAVDRRFNCEARDVLMNFLLAAHHAKGRGLQQQAGQEQQRGRQQQGRPQLQQPAAAEAAAETPVVYVPPHRRLDLSKLTSVGLSRKAGHAAARIVHVFHLLGGLEGWRGPLERARSDAHKSSRRRHLWPQFGFVDFLVPLEANLGCANLSCNLCKLSQRRRCEANFAPKYLAPCDVIEAKCGAQIYVVVVDPASGELVSTGLDDAFLQISIIDGRRFEHEGERDDALEECQLLLNKQGQPLLAHGRSGTYTDDKRMLVPMIRGQSILPDPKVTDSSEALLQGRAPPFRLLVRAVRRGGASIPNISHALSEPFVVATARVKGAAKLEIPHVDDHVSKIECVGVQTQKKLEDIRGASTAAGVPDLHIPINSVTKVGQFQDLVEMAESNKALRETLKQVLRLTKGWDVARDHVRRAVETDVQLRVFNPGGRTDVGLVFKCGAFNVVEMHRPVGLMRRRINPDQANQARAAEPWGRPPALELVDIIWLPLDPAAHPDAVKKLLPQASAAWWTAGHPGWQFLPLTTAHLPKYSDGGQPANLTSSFTFTVRLVAPHSGGAAAPGLAGLPLPGGVPQGLVNAAGFDLAAAAASSGGLPVGGQAARGPAPGSGDLSAAMTNSLTLDGGGGLPAMPSVLCRLPPLGGPNGLSGLAGLPDLQQPGGGLGSMVGLFPPAPGSCGAGLPPLLFTAAPGAGLLPGGLLAPGGGGVGGVGEGVGAAGVGGGPLGALQPQASAASMSTGGVPPPTLGGALGSVSDDSLSPFEDPTFQRLMSAVAANAPEGAPDGSGCGCGGQNGTAGGRGPAPPSGENKRKADTSLETWIANHKSLDFDFSLPPNLAQLSSLFTSLKAGQDMTLSLVHAGEGPPGASFPQAGHGQKQQRREGPPSGTFGQLGALEILAPAAAAAAVAPPPPNQQQQPAAPAGPAVQQPQAQAQQAQPQQEAPAPVPASQQPAVVSGVTMEQMQAMFQRAVRQEIPYSELETFLRQHNLLPQGGQAEGGGGGGAGAAAGAAPGGQSAPAAAGAVGVAPAPAPAPAPSDEPAPSPSVGTEPSLGLEDMNSIELTLPPTT